MIYSLNLFNRPLLGEAPLGNITRVARNWSRTSRATGGYWAGQFELSAEDVGPTALSNFFLDRLGCVVKERAGGLASWEGFIVEMRLIQRGVEFMLSLDPKWTRNRIRVLYSDPAAVDWDVGALDYHPAAGSGTGDRIQDVGQDFTPWASAAGPARYRIVVEQIGADDPDQWGFLGELVPATTNTVYVYEDVELTDRGWASSGRTDPLHYQIVPVEGSQQQDTGWLDDDWSQEQYGVIEAVLSEGQMPVETASIFRARELTAFGRPKARPVNVELGEDVKDRLMVMVAGFWHTLFWQTLDQSLYLGATRLIETLVDAAQFVTMRYAAFNGMGARADVSQGPRSYGELIQQVIGWGDLAGDLWHGGVYNDRGFGYGGIPKTVEYTLRGGVLYDRAGSPAHPALVRPGFLMRVENTYLGGKPPGGGVVDDPTVAYVDEVQFVAPDVLRLRLFNDEDSVITLRRQLRGL